MHIGYGYVSQMIQMNRIIFATALCINPGTELFLAALSPTPQQEKRETPPSV